MVVMAMLGSYGLATCYSQTQKVTVRLEVFTAVTMKNGVFWDVTPCGSEELSTSFIRVTRIGELGTTLALATDASCEEIPILLGASVASYS
jgi:hypothetical protein